MSRRFSSRGPSWLGLRGATGLLAAVGVLVPLDLAAQTTPASAAGSVTSYTPAPAPVLATITNGTSAAPWNLEQGDPGSSAYSSNGTGTVLPTYTPGGVPASGQPNLAVYPGTASATVGGSPYPSGVVGTPGPLDGYCGSGNTTTESSGSPVRQPNGTTLPLAPAYFPHIVRNADGSLTGYFDYRPKDADEAIVAASSTDNGRDWTYQGEALEQNQGYCPTADTNDDGEGHPNVITVGGTPYLYTLQRPAGDNAGVGMLVHPLTPTAANPLAGLPSSERVGIDPDAFTTSGVSVSFTGGTPATINLNQTGQTNSPEQLVPGPFVDLTLTPVPTPTSVITCTVVGTTTLSGCTSATAGGVTVGTGDLIEQVIGTVTGSTQTIPTGPNNTLGTGGLGTVTVAFTNNITSTILNNNAPNRVYVNGVAVYCNQSNANPTTKIENCTTGPGGPAITAAAGALVTSDPVVPATAQQTNGLVAPDGIVGVLPSYPGAPAGSTIVMYTEKLLNYFEAGVTSVKGTYSSTTGSSIVFFANPNTANDLPTPTVGNPVTVDVADDVKNSVIPATCTGLTLGTGSMESNSAPLADTLTGCTVPAADNGDTYTTKDQIGAPNAALETPTTLAKTGEGSTNQDKLYKNNEDYTLLRVAYTTDGINFSTNGLDNNGIISGQSNGASNYGDITDPTTTTDPPSGLNQYGTPGTADATEMRWVGSAGSIITNPNGSYGLFLSGAWAADGDSDSFNQIFYSSSTNGEQWTIPVSVVSTDYTFAASVAQDNNPSARLGISAYYSGRAYGPSVVQNPDGTLTMVFAGYRLPKPITTAGTVLGTNPSAQYTIGASDPALYRNILVETLSSSTSPAEPTTTSLAATTTSPVVGQPVTYTATVAPAAGGAGTPTGTVTFTGGTGTLCATTLDEDSSDQATCTTTYSGPGSDSVSASYGADSNYATSSSSPLGVTIAQDATATTLSSSPSAPVVGQPVTFTATVAVTAPGSGTPSGTVTIAGDQGTLCTATLNGDAPDQATCAAAETSTASDSITATYSGDTNDLSSASSPPQALAAGAASTTTIIATSDATPVTGEPVTYTTTVAVSSPGAGTPTGTVTVSGTSGVLCTGTLNQAAPDTATCATTYPGPGADSVTSAYGGDPNFSGSTSTAQSETIAKAQTATAISASPTAPVVGEPVTYTATVTVLSPGAGTPTGAVTFSDPSGTLCATTVDASTPDTATCTTTYDQSQNDTVTAAYAGDGDFDPSTSPQLGESVTPAATSTTISVDHPDPVVGQTVTYTATVTVDSPGSGTVAGSVTFTGDGGTLCRDVLVNEGDPDQATCTTNYPAVGSDSVTATYNGDANDLTSPSSSQPVSISQAATATGLKSSDTTPVVGQSITYTATVTASAPGTGTPTGTVTFAGDAGTLCTVALNRAVPDQATCTTSEAHAGDDPVTATYGGDPNYTGSPSSPVGEDVAAASTTTSLAETSGSTVAGQEITFTATVVTVSPGSGTPSGTVDFLDNGSAFCSTALSDTAPDQAACSTSFPTSGSLLVTAQYIGSNDDTSSTSNTLTESVGAAQTTTTVTASDEPSVTGQSITLTATVAPVAPSTGVPSGALVFSVETAGDKSLPCSGGDTRQLSNGQAACTIAGTKLTPAVGPLAVTAVFDGTSSYQTSQDSITHGIEAAATTVVVVSKDTPSPPGKAVNFTAAVSVTAPGAGRPQGTVTFSFSPAGTLACAEGDTVTVAKTSKPVSCKMAKGAITEPVTVTATYSGSAAYLTGSGSVSQAVL